MIHKLFFIQSNIKNNNKYSSVITEGLNWVQLTPDEIKKIKMNKEDYEQYNHMLEFINIQIITINKPQYDIVNITTPFYHK